MRQIFGCGMSAIKQADKRERFPRRLNQARLAQHVTPEAEAVSRLRLHRKSHIGKGGELREDRGNLKRSRNAEGGPTKGGLVGNVTAAEADRTCVGPKLAL